MGKIAKGFLFLIFIISLGLPPLAVRLRDTIDNQEKRIGELEVQLKETEDRLAEAKENIRSLNAQLKEEKIKRAVVERKLRSTRAELAGTKKNLKNVKHQLKEVKSNWNESLAKNRKYLVKIAGLEEKNAALQKEVAEKTKELKKLRKIAKGSPEVSTPEGAKRHAASGKGTVVGVYGKKYMTVVFSGDILNTPVQIYVHRKGRVVGKVNLRQLSNPTVVIETEDTEMLRRINEGDTVKLQAKGLIKPGFIEGRVDEVSPQNFVSIDVSEEACVLKQPVLVVYKGQEAIGKIKASRIVSLMAVGEFGEMERGMSVAERDYLVTPR